MENLTTKSESRYLLFILLWLAAILIFAYSWVPGGLDADSCTFGTIAKEILRTNHWLQIYNPVQEEVFYWHFPLCIWITAGIFKLFGASSFTAQLFSMFCGFTLVAVIFYFGRLLKNNWVGFFAGVSFLFTNHIIRIARKCRLDIPLSLFITLAMLSFYLAQKRSRFYYLLFGLFTCLAILSKEVSGLVPLAIGFLYLILRLRWKEFFHPLFILGVFIAIVPVFIWIRLDHSTLFTTWLNCNFLYLLKSTRFTEPWYYYIWVLATKYCYFLPFAIYGAYLAIKEARKNKNYEFYLLLIWVLIFPLAFSFGRHKVHYYILPVYPAASLFIGMAFDKMLKESIKLKVATIMKYLLIVISIVLVCFPLNLRSKRFSEAVTLAPAIDQLIKQLPQYEFIIYKQDKASLLFYSQELTRAEVIRDKQALEDRLLVTGKPKLCYLSERDFSELNPQVKQNCLVILKYKDRLIIAGPETPNLVVTLP